MYHHGPIDMETGEIDFSAVRNMLLQEPCQDKETGEFDYFNVEEYFSDFKEIKFKIPKEFLQTPDEEIKETSIVAKNIELPEELEIVSKNTCCPLSKMGNKCQLKEVCTF